MDQRDIFYMTLSGNFHNETSDILALANPNSEFYELCREFWLMSKSYPPYPEDEAKANVIRYITEHSITNIRGFLDLIYKRHRDAQGPDDIPITPTIVPPPQERQHRPYINAGTYTSPAIPFCEFFRRLTASIIEAVIIPE